MSHRAPEQLEAPDEGMAVAALGGVVVLAALVVALAAAIWWLAR